VRAGAVAPLGATDCNSLAAQNASSGPIYALRLTIDLSSRSAARVHKRQRLC